MQDQRPFIKYAYRRRVYIDRSSYVYVLSLSDGKWTLFSSVHIIVCTLPLTVCWFKGGLGKNEGGGGGVFLRGRGLKPRCTLCTYTVSISFYLLNFEFPFIITVFYRNQFFFLHSSHLLIKGAVSSSRLAIYFKYNNPIQDN